jgi:hypothetical protein
MRLAVVLLACAPSVFALGPLSFGLRAGAPLTDAFHAASTGNPLYSADTKRYTIGPSIELRLPFRTSVVFDILYKRLSYDVTTTEPGGATVQRSVTAGSFEFPLLVRHRFSSGLAQPFVEAGPTFNKLTGVADVIELKKDSVAGVAFGTGLEFKTPIIRLATEIRYTRRGKNFDVPTCLLSSNPNQVEFLIGLHF